MILNLVFGTVVPTVFEEYEIVLIPELLDIDKQLTTCPPVEITQNINKPYIIRDKLAWILGQIYASQRSQMYRGIRLTGGWTPINARILDRAVRNYKQYLNYLIKHDIIECNESYSNASNKKISKKYRIKDAYFNNNWKAYYLYNNRLVKSICHDDSSNTTKEEYSYLTKWFDRLTYNEEQAQLILSDIHGTNTPLFTQELFSLRKNILYQKGRFSVGMSNRLTTPICHLRKELRRSLRFNGEPLIEVDVKNSIPFISLVFFDINLLENNSNILSLIQNSIKENLDSYIDKLKACLYNAEQENNCYDRIGVQLYKNDNAVSYMFRKKRNPVDDFPDIAVYYDKVLNATLYQFLADEWNKELNTNYDRKKAKNKLLTIFNSPTSFTSKEKGYLYDQFPNVMKVIDMVNEGYFKTRKMLRKRERDTLVDGMNCPFAISSQKIEAWFVLEQICNKVVAKYPNIPFLTLHDSILTTPANVKTIKQVIQDESFNAFGRVCLVDVKQSG